ncbi:hypothetical protein QEN19_004349 [Hanseniaspora menglaensis]
MNNLTNNINLNQTKPRGLKRDYEAMDKQEPKTMNISNNTNVLFETDCLNFNKKLRLENNDEKFRQNLIKFEKLTEHLENNSKNVFELSTKLFTANGTQIFDNIKLYNKVIQNDSYLANGTRLSNISRRILNKSKLLKKINGNQMKKDGMKNYYNVALKKKINSSKNFTSDKILRGETSTTLLNKNPDDNMRTAAPVQNLTGILPVSSTTSLFQKKFTSSFLTAGSKKSFFNHVTSSRNNTKTTATSSKSQSEEKQQSPQLNQQQLQQQKNHRLKHHDFKKSYYSSDDSDDYDIKQLSKYKSGDTIESRIKVFNDRSSKEREGDTSSTFSSRISVSTESEVDDFEDDEGYWNDQFTPGKLHELNKKSERDFDEASVYSNGERDRKFDVFYHKKWDNLLQHEDLMQQSRAMKRIDTFEDDVDSVFKDREKLITKESSDPRMERTNVSNAPLAAHTLLPIAFHTHMFIPNSLRKNSKDSPETSMSYVGDEDDVQFYSEQQDDGENEPSLKQALKEDNEYKIMSQKKVMQDLRKQTAQKNTASLFQ